MAYALTIHKSQGLQYPIVLIPVHYRNYKLLNRNLGYIGVSREKDIVCLVGQMRAIAHIIRNVEIINRNTRLKDII